MIVGFLTVDYQLTGNCQGFGISIQRCTYLICVSWQKLVEVAFANEIKNPLHLNSV